MTAPHHWPTETIPGEPVCPMTTREGPPIRYQPICVLTGWGFIGGPSGYRRVPDGEPCEGAMIVEELNDAE